MHNDNGSVEDDIYDLQDEQDEADGDEEDQEQDQQEPEHQRSSPEEDESEPNVQDPVSRDDISNVSRDSIANGEELNNPSVSHAGDHQSTCNPGGATALRTGSPSSTYPNDDELSGFDKARERMQPGDDEQDAGTEFVPTAGPSTETLHPSLQQRKTPLFYRHPDC